MGAAQWSCACVHVYVGADLYFSCSIFIAETEFSMTRPHVCSRITRPPLSFPPSPLLHGRPALWPKVLVIVTDWPYSSLFRPFLRWAH